MSRHVSYRGTTIDMESLSRENEKVAAIGNMKVNAKGDQINHGVVTKTADQIARENYRVQSVIVNTGLKGKQPAAADILLDQPKPIKAAKPAVPATTPATSVSTVKEIELPSGDIIIDGGTDAN